MQEFSLLRENTYKYLITTYINKTCYFSLKLALTKTPACYSITYLSFDGSFFSGVVPFLLVLVTICITSKI